MTKKPNNFSIKQWPEGERSREKLIQFGAELLTDAELLAILLDGQNNLLAERIISEGIPTQSVCINSVIGRQQIDALSR